jgi:hypothetical protein
MTRVTLCTAFLSAALVLTSSTAMAQRVPRDVERAVHDRYPDARVSLIERTVRNGVETYMVRIEARDGTTSARVTEDGHIVFLGYPGVSYDRLPRPVTNVLDGIYRDRPEVVQKFERTTYLINADLGGDRYVLEFDPTGRFADLVPAERSIGRTIQDLPRASRSEVDSLQPRLRDYFNDPRVKEAYRHPDAEDYYWVELSTRSEDYVRVLMNDRRDVARYSTRIDQDQLPQAVTRTLRQYFPRADLNEIYRHNEIHYTALHDAGRDETLLIGVNPLGEVVRLREADAQDLRRVLADPDAERL